MLACGLERPRVCLQRQWNEAVDCGVQQCWREPPALDHRSSGRMGTDRTTRRMESRVARRIEVLRMTNRSGRSVNGWLYAVVVAIALILLFVLGEQAFRVKQRGPQFASRTTKLVVSDRPGTATRIVAEPMPIEIEPASEWLDRSSWVEYRTEAPASIAMIEPPSGVRLVAPVPASLSDPFQDFAAQPRLAMSESETRDSISANTVSTTRSIVGNQDPIGTQFGLGKLTAVTKNWPQALQLESELTDLREKTASAAADDMVAWVDRVQARLDGLKETEISDAHSAELLMELRREAQSGFAWAKEHEIQMRELACDVTRTAHALKRRLAIWVPVHRCMQTGSKTFVARRNYQVNREQIAVRLQDAAKAIVRTGDGENWARYLMLDRIDDLARGEIESREHQVVIAREFLSRVTDHRVTAEQRRVLTSAEIHLLADEIHPLTIAPVDYRKVLMDVEAIESRSVHRCGEDLADAIQSLRFSEHIEQARIADAIATHYRNANIRLSVSEGFINRLMPRNQTATRPVQQRILGADTRGASHVQSNLEVKLVPDATAWHVKLMLDGDITSNTRSSRSGATFYNSTQAMVQSERDIRIDPQSLKIDGTPTSVASSDALRRFSTEWDQIPVMGDMIRYFAHQEFVQSRPVAKRITQKLIARQTDDEFDRQLQTQIDGARTQFDQRWIGPLQSLQLHPMVLDMQTTDSRLTVRYRIAGTDQIAAYTPRPVAPGDSLISLQLHQSTFNNLIAQAIDADRDWTIASLAEEIARVLQLPPPELPEDTPEDIVIRFMNPNPMTVEFEGGRMWLTLCIESLEQPGRIHLKNFTIRTSYQPSIDGLKTSLVRDGMISVDGHRLGARDRLPLRAIFAKVFSGRPELPMVAEQLANDPRAKGMAVSQLEMRDGWFAMAVSEESSPHVSAIKAAQSTVR